MYVDTFCISEFFSDFWVLSCRPFVSADIDTTEESDIFHGIMILCKWENKIPFCFLIFVSTFLVLNPTIIIYMNKIFSCLVSSMNFLMIWVKQSWLMRNCRSMECSRRWQEMNGSAGPRSWKRRNQTRAYCPSSWGYKREKRPCCWPGCPSSRKCEEVV